MRGAFTLIELLVVITIVVVLLALLAPALDKAVYQAELTMCGAHQRTIAAGAQLYAAGHRRRYPGRQRYFMANVIHDGASFDWRPWIGEYVSLAAMNDPLTDKLEFSAAAVPAGRFVMATYDMYFGWKFQGQRGMDRLGARWSWTDDEYPGGPRPGRFAVIVADRIRLARHTWALLNHPDQTGAMFMDTDRRGDSSFVYSRWRINGTHRHDGLEMSFAMEDGSVFREAEIRYNDPQDVNSLDDRFARVPNYGEDQIWGFPSNPINWPNEWHNVPRR